MPRARARRAALLVLLPAVAAVAVALPAHPAAAGAPAPAAVARALPAVPAPAVDQAAAVRHAEPGHHTVVPGETLSHIAQRYGVGVARLAAANGLADPDHVRHGTTLVIPVAAPSGAAAPSGGLPARLQQSPARLSYIPVFDRWAAANAIPADLLKAMTWLESGWQNHLVSSTGAVGIGQLMPDTVDYMELLIGRDLDPTVVEDNIRMSARYLRWLLGRYGGDAASALAGYYQGPASVERQGTLAETDVYVENVLALRARF